MTYACRRDNGTLKPTHHGSRQELYCPSCQFQYREPGCLFATVHDAHAFGAPVPATRRQQGAGSTNNLTGGQWRTEDILESMIDYRDVNGEWPKNTTDFRKSNRLPHSATIYRRFGTIEAAVAQASATRQRQIEAGEYHDDNLTILPKPL